MKRRYKAGDWVRVPLGGDRDALVIIARACRSRLFGYFFAYPSSQAPSHGELRALRHADAIAVMLFGGAPIEDGRWQIIATSLAFDESAWPFPAFASRGAFGDAWTQVRYDPQSLQIVERVTADAEQARSLPDARFAHAHEAEETLRLRLAGKAPARAHSTCEVRSPIDPARMHGVADGGCVQFSTALGADDLDVLRAFLEAHPHVRIRVHGFRRGFDARQISSFVTLGDLTLDVHQLQHARALANLSSLRALRLGAMRIDLAFLDALRELETLELRGTRAPLAPVERCESLRSLHLENTPPVGFAAMASAGALQSLTIAHGEYDLGRLGALPELRHLELRALDAAHLPPLERLDRLERLVLDDLRAITDLSPIARARSLRELQIAGMPQLNVEHFEPLKACAGLRDLRLDVGSRRKEREIYHLLRFGNT